MSARVRRVVDALVLTVALVAPVAAATAGVDTACRIDGFEREARCLVVPRPLDPLRAGSPSIGIHVVVLPAQARHKHPDPVVFFAGGPGQSAIALAGPVVRLLGRANTRRDLVLIDQRGTGRSAPLSCDEDPPTRPLREVLDVTRQHERLAACRERLQALPHGDLRRYTTWHAAQDVDAVRQALGAARVNLVGASYGTRVALEVLRQFPQHVRRVVLDGVAPADMALPAAFSTDGQAALDAVWQACRDESACAARFPALRDDWARLLAGLPATVAVVHPVTGEPETLTLTREAVLGLVRAPLYRPALAAALPEAVTQAAQGRWDGVFGLGMAIGAARRGQGLAQGMHLSVICAEDLPRLAGSRDAAGADFGDTVAMLYRRNCADWPRGEVPPGFYLLPPAPVATLVLSGGADPATPTRHGERVVRALGGRARHVVVGEAGHGVIGIGCLRDVVFRFIDAADDRAALAVDASCAGGVPRPPAFLRPRAAAAEASR